MSDSGTSGRSEKEIFFEALDKHTPQERAAFLDGAFGANRVQRAKMEALLADHFQQDSFMKEPAVEASIPTLPSVPPSEAPAQMLGRYKLLEKIGEGGFGEVWMAEQREPIKRRVALKIIKLGMDSRQIVNRFAAERQALAMMDHANIAKIFDADVTEAGRPYFVMELVRGIRITEYCDQNQLPTHERLRLFILVCQAIQHAHQKGIIHRDIKPSNILVTLHDGKPVPKVIDFGIAKATQQELTDKTVFTQFQQFIGTPAYISPEQAEMSGLDIDTRADIYSLGVLLYELLVSQTPFDAKEMMQGGIDALRQIIREREPLRPSTKLNTLAGEARTTAGKRRQTDVGKLVHQLQGDLDWIAMKCLEKDRTRRYDTANGLAMDIHRHLDSEPVKARPPSSFYRLQKLVRRHRGSFAAAGAVILVLLAGVTASISLLLRENATMRRALRAEQSAKTERLRNDEAARSMTRSGTAYLKRGDLEAAEKALLEALAMRRTPPDGGDKQAAELLSALAQLRHAQQDFAEAERLARESIRIRRRTQQDDPALAQTLNYLADARYERGDLPDAERFLREALAIMRRNGSNDPATLQWSLYALAETLERQNKFAEADPFYRELLAGSGASEPPADSVLSPAVGFARCLTELAWIEQQQGKSAHAVALAREAETIVRAGLEMDPHPGEKRAWQLAEMKSRLGGAMLVETAANAALQPPARLSELAKVEPLLLESEGQLQDDATVHPNWKRDAIDRLVRLYEVWNGAAPGTGKSEKATQWKVKRDAFDKAEAERRAAAFKPKPATE